LINSVGIICNLISVCNVHFDQYIFDSLNFSSWVYIIEQLNLYWISTKQIVLKNHYLQVRLFTIATFINAAHDLQIRYYHSRICKSHIRM